MSSSFSNKWNGILIENAIKQEGPKRLRDAALLSQREIKKTLTGRRTGRTYRIPGTSRTYVASAPGEPPAVRTGHLRNSIMIVVDKEKMEAIVGPEKMSPDYARDLEFGSNRRSSGGDVGSVGGSLGFPTPGRRTSSVSQRGAIAPRPFMQPTFNRIRKQLEAILSKPWI